MSIYLPPASSRKPKARKSKIGSLIKASKIGKVSSKWWIISASIIGSILVIVGIVDRALIRNERYRMQIIEINNSGQVPYTQLADTKLVEALQDKHYYLTKYSNTLSKLITSYPPLSSLVLSPSAQVGIYQLSVGYTPPQIVMRFQGNTLGLVGENLYPVQADYSGLVLQLPSYSTGMTLSGLFYQVPAAQLVKQYQAIVRGLQDENIQRLTYHVAASQIQVNTSTQEIYFNVAGNIFEQLKNYRSLSGNTEQIPFNRVIDLGSINNGVFVYP